MTAWVNDLYYVDQRGYKNLFDHSSLGGIHANPKSLMQRYDYVDEDLEERQPAGGTPAQSQRDLRPLAIRP